MKLIFDYEWEQFDVETAFLYGDLEETLYMELPEGYDDYVREVHGYEISKTTHCVLLEKAIYGLVQAARQWSKRFKRGLKEIGFKPNPADPCSFVRDKDGEKTFIIIYVDDGLIIGSQKNILEVKSKLEKIFSIGESKEFYWM